MVHMTPWPCRFADFSVSAVRKHKVEGLDFDGESLPFHLSFVHLPEHLFSKGKAYTCTDENIYRNYGIGIPEN